MSLTRAPLALALAVVALAAPAAAAATGFDPQRLPLAAEGLVDLGVVDLERDGDLDLFTNNHSFRQVLLADDGSGVLTDVLYDLGLEQEPRFPGVEDMFARPTFDETGPYVYFDARLRLHLRGTPGSGPARGHIRFLSPVAVEHASGIDHEIEIDDGSEPARTTVRYAAEDGFHLVLAPRLFAIPIRFRLADVVEPAAVRVGPGEVAPEDRTFAIFLRDRHGIAWADVGGDAAPDAFVVRGGLRGAILDGGYGRILRDELMIAGAPRFRDMTTEAGLVKEPCRGRQAAAADYSGDGQLDLFESCLGGSPLLYRQESGGTFAGASQGLREAGVSGSFFRFVDLVGRGSLELLAAGEDRFVAYRFAGKGTWQRVDGARGRHNGPVAALAVADFDGDRDADAFAAAPSGNTLLINDGGVMRAMDPGAMGLPATGDLAASWVDYDSDGLLDLHVVPGGLFRRLPGDAFEQVAGPAAMADPRQATLGWPDLDGDGDRDAVIATIERGRIWDAALAENAEPQGHWLQLDLEGPPGNREAIGARVVVQSASGRQTQWVGQSESSRYSQGHYRLYFGLGDDLTADAVRVRWPDGTIQELGLLLADRRVEVSHP